MLMVKTKLSLSKIQGIGLFADEDIPKGTVVYKTCRVQGKFLDLLEWSEGDWKILERHLNEEAFKQIKRHAYKYKKDGAYVLELDDAKFINHSSSPNIVQDEVGCDIAVKDIKSGEEILIDYRTFYDPIYFEEIMKL